MDIVTSGIAGVFRGKPLFIDATCISPINGRGQAKSRADKYDGKCFERKDNETKDTDYPDVEASQTAQLLSLSVEVFGRWGPQSLQLVCQLAKYKVAAHLPVLRKRVALSLSRRWWSILNDGLQKNLAVSLLQGSGEDLFDEGRAIMSSCFIDFPA